MGLREDSLMECNSGRYGEIRFYRETFRLSVVRAEAVAGGCNYLEAVGIFKSSISLDQRDK